MKKEYLEPVPESDADPPLAEISDKEQLRPRAQTAQSESTLTVFANGHHKPAHKHNTMAHKSGLPYVIPRAHSIHGASPGGFANRSVDNLPHTSTIEALHGDSLIKDSMMRAQQEQRQVRSEHGSPHLPNQSNLDHLNGRLPPLDLSNIDNMATFGYPVNYNGFATMPEHEQPIFSAGLSNASVDWSHYDGLEFNDTFATSSYSQAPSFTGLEFAGLDQPAMTTTSTSGEISEVEDFVPVNNYSPCRPALAPQCGSELDTSDFGDRDGYGLSSTSSYMNLQDGNLMSNADLESLDMDEFLKGVSMNNFVPGTPLDGLPMSHNGFPAVTYVQGFKSLSAVAPLDAPELEFGLPTMEDDNDTLWMQDFSSHNMPLGSSAANSSNSHGGPWPQ